MSLVAAGRTIDRMQSVAYAAPLLRDQAEAGRVALASCHLGEHKERYQDSRRRAGIIREAVWLQAASDGLLAVVYMEADDIGDALRMLRTSPEPFERWFRHNLRHIHGLALDNELFTTELVLDFNPDSI